MKQKQSELTVTTKAKDLCSYIMTITQKSPKKFRFTFVSRLQSLILNVIENIYRANDVFISKDDLLAQQKRLELQRKALTDLKVLGYAKAYEIYKVQKKLFCTFC
ncbi:four helix bundle protein [Emergencia sp. 1XD21-10]|uniref:four helix bundle protein n=1 Tax=Emergencia sp. 1XD21-10 TaxID=2304569 RepID=UPI00137AE380|nr:four helix bundle protein [Emergencia sp. 1XD21-10]NCE97589.1 four helix bundle protein [Emergencia sp. 1XD21-10]